MNDDCYLSNICLFTYIAGGQTTIVFDCKRRFPRAYIHRHKLHERPKGFGAEGPAEMHHLLTQLNAMVETTPETSTTKLRNNLGVMKDYPVKKIYTSHPHGTADNHFSGEPVLDFAGKLGFGLTLTTRRDRFATGLKPYMHHDKLTPKDQRSRCMRFGNPIVAIKEVPSPDPTARGYTKTHVSFQSTGATNITGVNNLLSAKLSVVPRERGIGDQKRHWGIEWNEARDTYLGFYWAVDNVDHMIKNAAMRFISWKYWHSPTNHCHAIAVTAAYDIYLYCCDGLADPEWAVPPKERMSFRNFRMILSGQQLKYDPKDGFLPGDENFRANTKLTRRQKRGRKRKNTIVYEEEGVTEANFQQAKTERNSRLCGDLDQLLEHTQSMDRKSNAGNCEVCGVKSLWKCMKCDKYMCVLDNKRWTGGQCLIRFHNDTFFGLAKADESLTDSKKWKKSNENTIARHAQYIKMISYSGDAEVDGAVTGV